jgi:hypothetical protein
MENDLDFIPFARERRIKILDKKCVKDFCVVAELKFILRGLFNIRERSPSCIEMEAAS